MQNWLSDPDNLFAIAVGLLVVGVVMLGFWYEYYRARASHEREMNQLMAAARREEEKRG